MHKKAIGVLTVLCFLVFGHGLFNDFVGDDHSFIVENDFYREWTNVSHLFSGKYITDADDVFNKNTEALLTGSVAYRPVLSLTYFVDYALWGINPFGYHLTNVMLHLFNTLLVYYCLFVILMKFSKYKFTSPKATSLLAAIIFCIHPLKVEPVCSIGYRADLLACFFVLCSFLLFLETSREDSRGIQLKSFLSLFCFFLALFSKESVVIYPLILMAFEWVFTKRRLTHVMGSLFTKYKGFFVILLFYAFLYIFIMPNSSLRRIALLGGSFANHGFAMTAIFCEYLLAIVFPPMVKILPPTHLPAWEGFSALRAAGGVLAALLLVLFVIRNVRKYDERSFFVLWFLVCLIPVLNVIPLATPFAYRFMYLPSLGFSALIAWYFDRWDSFIAQKWHQEKLMKIVKTGYLLLCVIITYFSVFAWKNNLILAQNMIKDFPSDPAGYLFLGIQYEKKGMRQSAQAMASESLRRGIQDPRAYHILGRAEERDKEKSLSCFERCIRLYPRYAACYTGAGRILLFKNELGRSRTYLQKSLALTSSFSSYVYLLQNYLLEGNFEQADRLYAEAKQKFSHRIQQEILKDIYELFAVSQLPKDYGF